MQAAILDDRTGRNTSFLASLITHLLVGAALLFVPLAGRRFVEPDEPVPVAIVVPAASVPSPAVAPRPPVSARPHDDQAGNASPAEVKPPVSASLSPRGPSTGAKAGEEGLITARTMLSAGALANPRSRKAMQQLRTFSPDERIVQLCNIEAMEQVHAGQPAMLPEAVSPYAFQDLKLRGGSVVADGAAFYSGHLWYELRFACDVRAGKVVAFAFRIGQPVPRAHWEEHNLAEPIDADE